MHKPNGQEGMIAAVAALFVLAMAGLWWQVFRLSDDSSCGLALRGAELQQAVLLLGIVCVAGLSGFVLAVARMRRGTKVLEHLVNERTAELVAATQRANQTAQDKAQILSTVNAFFIGVDASGKVCEWTSQAENLFDLPLPEVFGRTFREASIRWNWEPILDAINRSISTLSTVHLDKVPIRTHEDRQRFLKLTISPLCKDSGVEAVIMGEDITGRLVLEHDLAQAQRLESIGQLAAGIAHEINTPIQFVGDNVRFLCPTPSPACWPFLTGIGNS
ncbi:MAG: hypothetical protein NNA22_08075 [Nitrospira sp.]|nr:hypothetical protein [Nitrospira sp.]